ncbi:MAG TPA: hypothetical protein VJN22_04395 [Candidatus Eremiobacteraceae bacterium]|nr:hypothetical protein [Candidatus Eremiobacteraceae bacterium]
MAALRSRPIPFVALAASAVIIALVACSGQSAVNPGTAQQGHAARPMRAADPIQLVPGTTVGQDVFPEGDTQTGGQGQQVDGINCRKALNSTFHHHVHLSLFVNGVQYAIPRGTGIKNPGKGNFIYHGDCFYFLHTHDATGIIHMEPPKAMTFGLHQYFDEWGMQLSTTNVAGYQGAVTVFVNGTQENVDPNTIKFNPFDQITLEVGTPVVTPPVYIFPPHYP